MTASIGHNGGPSLEGQKVSLRTAWAKALFADPETPTYVIAMAWVIHWYSRADGSGAAVSNQQFQDMCGLSQPTATRGKRWLRDSGYVQLRIGTGEEKTQFQMVIPERVITEDRVVCETTPQQETTQGEVTPKPQMTQGQTSDDPGVVPRLLRIQDRDSGDIQDNKKRAAADKSSFWKSALNPSHEGSDISFSNGKLTLLNGTRVDWLKRFGDDEQRLDLALIQAASYLQPNSNRSLQVQVNAQLARIAGDKRDKDSRYIKAAKDKSDAPVESRSARLRRFVEEASEALTKNQKGSRP